MAISHADHDHPNTPAARAACRKAAATVNAGLTLGNPSNPSGKPAKMTVVPRRRGDGGVVKGMQATAPKAAARRLKVSGTMIKSIGDLADVPAVLAGVVRQAWARNWDVQAGHPFNDDERRIVISGPVAEFTLVWDSNGRTGFFVRHWASSVTSKIGTSDDGFRVAGSADRWDEACTLVR